MEGGRRGGKGRRGREEGIGFNLAQGPARDKAGSAVCSDCKCTAKIFAKRILKVDQSI